MFPRTQHTQCYIEPAQTSINNRNSLAGEGRGGILSPHPTRATLYPNLHRSRPKTGTHSLGWGALEHPLPAPNTLQSTSRPTQISAKNRKITRWGGGRGSILSPHPTHAIPYPNPQRPRSKTTHSLEHPLPAPYSRHSISKPKKASIKNRNSLSQVPWGLLLPHVAGNIRVDVPKDNDPAVPDVAEAQLLQVVVQRSHAGRAAADHLAQIKNKK